MDVLLTIVAICIVVMFMAIWKFNKKEDTDFQGTINKLTEVKDILKGAKESIDAQRTTLMEQNIKIQELESKVAVTTDELQKIRVEIGNIQGQQTQLANKRPMFKITSPIPVQIIPTVKQTQSPNSEMLKKIKSQLKEVSR